MKHEIEKQIEFLMEIDKSKGILRMNWMLDQSRREDDAQHAWHACLTAMVLQKYAARPVDIGHVIQMLLVHDIVEIDAGDTYAYDKEGLQTQKAREEAAKERIFSLLPEDQKKELAGLFDEFEAFETKESKYAHAMDNLQPLILNHSNGGEDWKRHGVTKGQVYGRQGKTKLGSNRLFQVVDAILQENIEKGNIKEREEEK